MINSIGFAYFIKTIRIPSHFGKDSKIFVITKSAGFSLVADMWITHGSRKINIDRDRF